MQSDLSFLSVFWSGCTMASFHLCQDIYCNCTRAVNNTACICQHTAGKLVALQVSKMVPKTLSSGLFCFTSHSSCLTESIVPLFRCFVLFQGGFSHRKKEIWHYLFIPKGFQNASHIIMWIHGFAWFTPGSPLNSGVNWQLFKFPFWPDMWRGKRGGVCLGICFLTSRDFRGQNHPGKMTFHSRLPTWQSPKRVRLRTDQGVYMLHFTKN